MLSGVAGEAVTAMVWLGVVLALILGAARAVRSLPSVRSNLPAGALVLRGSLVLDGRRRLHLVQAGQHQVLVLNDGAGERMVLLPTPGSPC